MSEDSQEIALEYVTLEVSNLERSVDFFQNQIGLSLEFSDAKHGYASFRTPVATFGIVQSDEAEGGRHTGFGFMVTDLDAVHARLSAQGVVFTQPPTQESWGGYMAIFSDPDGNTYFLDQTNPPETHAAPSEKTDTDADKPVIDFSVNLTAGSIKED